MTIPSSPICTGLWKTEGGSYFDLQVHQDNTVSGFYCSIHGQPQPDEKFPLLGYVNHDLIGFAVSWQRYRSMTSWCGRYDVVQGRPCIRTVWHLGRTYADRQHTVKNEYWETFLNYSGIYYLQ